jgi:hypothetical protein
MAANETTFFKPMLRWDKYIHVFREYIENVTTVE